MDLALEMRRTLRSFRRNPLAPLAAVLVSTVGITFSAVVFCLVERFFFGELPYTAPEQLVALEVRRHRSVALQPTDSLVSLDQLALRSDLFTSVAAYALGAQSRVTLDIGGSAILSTANVSASLFGTLGTHIDQSLVHENALLLTPRASQRLAGQIRSLLLDGSHTPTPVTVASIGDSFVFPSPFSVIPVEAVRFVDARTLNISNSRAFIARLQPGIEPHMVSAALASVLPKAFRVEVTPLSSYMTRRMSVLSQLAVSLSVMLLVGSASTVMALAMARANARATEFGVRVALGATTRQVFGPASLEGATEAAAAVVLALLLTSCVLNLLVAFGMPAEYLYLGSPTLGRPTLLFISLGGILTYLAYVAAFWASGNLARHHTLHFIHRFRSSGRFFRSAIILSANAVAVILLTSSVLLVSTYISLMRKEPGMSLGTVVITVSSTRRGAALEYDMHETIRRIGALPQVDSAAAAVGSMLDSQLFPAAFTVDTHVIRGATKRVTEGYFRAASSTFVRGSPFSATEESAVVVNATFAAEAWPLGGAVGRRIGPRRDKVVVGVIRDEITLARDTTPLPIVYSLLTRAWEECRGAGCGRLNYLVKPTDDHSSLAYRRLQREILEVDPTVAIVDVRTIGDRLDASVRDRAFAAGVLSLTTAASIGICLMAVGTITAIVVSHRVVESAIRAALGAGPSTLLRYLTADILVSGACGAIAGLVACFWVRNVLQSLVDTTILNTLGIFLSTAASMLVMTGVTAIGVALPATRAAPSRHLQAH